MTQSKSDIPKRFSRIEVRFEDGFDGLDHTHRLAKAIMLLKGVKSVRGIRRRNAKK